MSWDSQCIGRCAIRKALEKVFLALCSFLVCLCYSGNLRSYPGMILIVFVRGVLADRALSVLNSSR